ncbi:acyl carrier protein-like protein (plasmid) [Streptomyces sp. 769]|nr:acyl carrier protein-like protein [Streptomyces sp. 769]
MTVEDLKRILLQAAGSDSSADLARDIADISFDELGYDSLARLETVSRIERELGIRLDDATAEAPTPRELVELVNQKLVPSA